MLSLFLSYALATCRPMWGVQQQNGSWNFYYEQMPGTSPMTLDSNCDPAVRTAEIAADKAAELSQKQLQQQIYTRLNAIDLDQPIDGETMRSVLKDIREILKAR